MSWVTVTVTKHVESDFQTMNHYSRKSRSFIAVVLFGYCPGFEFFPGVPKKWGEGIWKIRKRERG